MFKLSKLVMYDYQDREYIYHFSEGLNYYRGENNTGKTEFYSFLNFMFGSSDDIKKKPWYKDSLKMAILEICIDKITLNLVRTYNPDVNYIYYSDEKGSEAISLREYKDKLNSIFAKDSQFLRSIRDFTEEELTYRTFTLFNFFGEKRQGAIQDFFDKCSDIKYSVKLPLILNFVLIKTWRKFMNFERNF